MPRKRQPKIRICEWCSAVIGAERGPAAKTCSPECQRDRNNDKEKRRYALVKNTEEWKATRASYLEALRNRKAIDPALKERLQRAHRAAVARYSERLASDPRRRAEALEYKRDWWRMRMRMRMVNNDPILRAAVLQRQRDWYRGLTEVERDRIFYAPRRWRKFERDILARLEFVVKATEDKAAINWVMRNQNLKHWSGEEIMFLREHYAGMQASEIAKQLRRTTQAVQRQAGRMGLLARAGRVKGGARFDGERSEWTLAEERILRELYGRFTALQLAEAMGRSYLSVKARIRKLRLTHQYERRDGHVGARV